ncbi:MAG: alpha/beta fold hydrolase [Kiloniellales bacterium]
MPLLKQRSRLHSKTAAGAVTLRPLQDLADQMKALPLPLLDAALKREIAKRAAALTAGIEAYRQHPYRRAGSNPKLVWQEGTTRLLDFAPESKGRPFLLIPSLINRAYILDLDQNTSLCSWLAGQGFHPYLVDWDSPAEEERGFSMTDYVAGRLCQILDHVEGVSQQRPLVLGYCLGGLLALGLAQLECSRLAGLVLLATPWDFHAEAAVAPSQLRLAALMAAPLIDSQGYLPVDGVQTLFYALDPWLAIRKFTAFAARDPDAPAAKAFVALEDWLNDGVPLAGPVARELLFGWYAENRPQRGLWRLAGRRVEPGKLELPTLAIIPHEDRIVPPSSALALAEALPNVTLERPAAGHIGMIVGRNAISSVWQPIARWGASLP